MLYIRGHKITKGYIGNTPVSHVGFGKSGLIKIKSENGGSDYPNNLIAKYTANASGVLPTFNSGYQYTINETESNGVYTVEISSDSDFTSCNFNGKTGLLTVEYLKVTANVTTMENLFNGCTSLTRANTSNWDTSNVTTMSYMFNSCSKLTQLDVSNFDTSKVIAMANMFNKCFVLTQLDVSNFDTSNVTNMSWMFSHCRALTTLDVSNFNTSNVTNMQVMFSGCNNITSLDVSNFNTSKVTNIHSMFSECLKLRSLDLSNFDTSNVTNMYYMIGYNLNLETLNLNNFKFATNGGSIFGSNISLTKIYINIVESLNNSIKYLSDRTGKEPGYIVTTLRDQIDEETMNQLNAKNWFIKDLIARYTTNTSGVISK